MHTRTHPLTISLSLHLTECDLLCLLVPCVNDNDNNNNNWDLEDIVHNTFHTK